MRHTELVSVSHQKVKTSKMGEVNYITHLNTVFQYFLEDNRLNPTHISLYMALFQIWNSTRFPDEFYVIRNEVMMFSKIGSKSTYHRCLKELHEYGYIEYMPSHNPYRGSKIKLTKIETSSGQALYHNNLKIESSTGQVSVPRYKHNKTVIKGTNNNKQESFKNSDLEDFENGVKQNASVPYTDNLKTIKDKNYNEPL
jgi:hypothetical protein